MIQIPQPTDYSSALNPSNTWKSRDVQSIRRGTDTGSSLTLNPVTILTDVCGNNAYETLTRSMTIIVIKGCTATRWGSITMSVTVPFGSGQAQVDALLNTNIRLQPTQQVTTFLNSVRQSF